MKTVLAPNAPWPGREPAPEPKPPKEVKPREPRTPSIKKVVPFEIKLMQVTFNEDGSVSYMEEVKVAYQPRIEGCHSYKGQSANIFNEGFRAAERIYNIGNRKQRTK